MSAAVKPRAKRPRTASVLCAIVILLRLVGDARSGPLDTLRVQPVWFECGALLDGQLSLFWQEWAARGADSLILQAPSSCYQGWCRSNGPDDCRMIVKAAASNDGLYVCAVVHDDSWAETPPRWDPFADVISFWFDLRPPGAIAGCDSCVVRDTGSGLTSTSLQLDVPLSREPSLVRRWSWYNTVTRAWSEAVLIESKLWEALDVYGDHILIDERTSAVEFFLAWCALGVPHFTRVDTLALSFTAGYADRDSGQSDTLVLRWDGIDPLAHQDGVSAWGVMAFGAGTSVYNRLGHCTLETSAILRPHSSRQTAAPDAFAAHAGRIYDLRGRRLGADVSRASGLLLLQPAGRGTLILQPGRGSTKQVWHHGRVVD